MESSFYTPVKIILGDECVRKNAALLERLGKKALIITSPSSQKNGSLADIKAALQSSGIAWAVYDRTTPNPDLPLIGDMGKEARAFGCDFLIGLGGGSAMDACKAAAVLAANDMEEEDVYNQPYPNKPLPIVAIPTTCGTGSEVTAISVLTYGNSKKSIKSPDLFPKIAFLDARYIDGLPQPITVDTAVDALSHAAEGYLMVDSWLSDMFSERVFEFFGSCTPSLLSGQYTHATRERQLFMAMVAGLTLNITGTAAVHAMGYPMTTLRNVPHGRACGLLLGEYVDFCLPARKEKIGKMLSLLGLPDVDEFKNLLHSLLGKQEQYTPAELEKFTEISYQSAIVRANPVKMEKSDVLDLFKKSLL